LRWAGRERITLGRDFQRETEKNLREKLHLLNKDDEQNWIEKYRAALLSPPTNRRSRLFAALKSLAGTLGLAVGKTSGKMANPVPHSGLGEVRNPRIARRQRFDRHHPVERKADRLE
jgi:hypothetical protein